MGLTASNYLGQELELISQMSLLCWAKRNISGPFLLCADPEFDLRLKAWPRGLRPLRCSFASLRMTPWDCRHAHLVERWRPTTAKPTWLTVIARLA